MSRFLVICRLVKGFQTFKSGFIFWALNFTGLTHNWKDIELKVCMKLLGQLKRFDEKRFDPQLQSVERRTFKDFVHFWSSVDHPAPSQIHLDQYCTVDIWKYELRNILLVDIWKCELRNILLLIYENILWKCESKMFSCRHMKISKDIPW